MANNSTVNPQITDAVTQSNGKVTIADASSIALATLYQAMSQNLAMLFANANTAQQNMNIIGEATVTQGVTLIYSSIASAKETSMNPISEVTKK